MLGDDLFDADVVKELWSDAQEFYPDLIAMEPPCGLWSSWQDIQEDQESVQLKQEEQLPFWRLVRKLWEFQSGRDALALSEQPESSKARRLSIMTSRSRLYIAIIDQ